MNDRPTGQPATVPAGIVTCGSPEIPEIDASRGEPTVDLPARDGRLQDQVAR